ncbi:MAG: hypothetical protein ABSH08_00160 [Tepidisphaeraceae bacterium]|jgi:hypothetical protein
MGLESLISSRFGTEATCIGEFSRIDAEAVAMKTVSIKDNATAEDLLQQGADEEVLVLRDGHPIALLTPFDDDDLEWFIPERDPAFIESIARARKQIAEGDTISMEDLKKEFGMD